MLSSGTSYPLSMYSIPAGTAIVKSSRDRPVFDDSLLNSSRNSCIIKCLNQQIIIRILMSYEPDTFKQLLLLLKTRSFLCHLIYSHPCRLDTPNPNQDHQNCFVWETWEHFSRILFFYLRRLLVSKTWQNLRSILLLPVKFSNFCCMTWDR